MEMWVIHLFLTILLVLTVALAGYVFGGIYAESKAEKKAAERKMKVRQPEVDYAELEAIAYKRSFTEICKGA